MYCLSEQLASYPLVERAAPASWYPPQTLGDRIILSTAGALA